MGLIVGVRFGFGGLRVDGEIKSAFECNDRVVREEGLSSLKKQVDWDLNQRRCSNGAWERCSESLVSSHNPKTNLEVLIHVL